MKFNSIKCATYKRSIRIELLLFLIHCFLQNPLTSDFMNTMCPNGGLKSPPIQAHYKLCFSCTVFTLAYQRIPHHHWTFITVLRLHLQNVVPLCGSLIVNMFHPFEVVSTSRLIFESYHLAYQALGCYGIHL